jgi:transposase, IS5 family
MLRNARAQATLWKSILPETCLGLPAELKAVDQLLDDPTFCAWPRARAVSGDHCNNSVS